MPLEINEIAITMRVTSDREDTGRQPNAGAHAEEEREELIEECIRRVLQALKIERER